MPETIAEVLTVLRGMDASLTDDDGLKWFNHLYLRTTEAVAERIAEGGFANPAWIERLDAVFASHYFTAVEAWEARRPVPGCWSALLDRRGNPAVARAQFALAGANAHINHDLPVAIVETLSAMGVAPHVAGVQYADFTSLNGTLGALVETAKAELMVRLPGDALPPVTHLEDTLAAWSLAAAREAAWTNAELLWDVRDIPLMSGRYLDVIDGLATVAGKALLVPVPLT